MKQSVKQFLLSLSVVVSRLFVGFVLADTILFGRILCLKIQLTEYFEEWSLLYSQAPFVSCVVHL